MGSSTAVYLVVHMLPYKELIVWQKAFAFSVNIYKATDSFPQEEKFGLQSQIRRAGVSIPSNIAEGSKRGTNKDYVSFLRVAHGSAAEVETQLMIAQELGYVTESKFFPLKQELDEIMKILASLIRKLA